jgi:hypothetical protein
MYDPEAKTFGQWLLEQVDYQPLAQVSMPNSCIALVSDLPKFPSGTILT